MINFFFTQGEAVRHRRGAALLIVVILSMLGSLMVTTGIGRTAYFDILRYRTLFESKQSFFAAESGAEDMIYRYRAGKNISATEVLNVGNAVVTTATQTVTGGKKIEARGNVSGSIRKTKAILIEGAVGIGFFYGAHIGEGGLVMTSSSMVNGNVYSNGNINGSSDSQINGDAAAVGTISTPRPLVTGTKTESVPLVPLPPIDLDFWRTAANVNSDPYIGNYSQGSGSTIFGPKKFDGNFSLNSDANVTITGPIHVTGNFTMNSDTELFLDGSFGSNGTVIVVDGTITFNSSAKVHATAASPKGYILFVTPSTSASAIKLNSDAVLGAAVYATAGTVTITSDADVIAVTGYQLQLNSDAAINYDIGLASALFSSGPSGGYVISEWKETE